MKIIVFTRILIKIKIGSLTGIRLVAFFLFVENSFQWKNSKETKIITISISKNTILKQTKKKEPRKNVKKKVSKTKLKKLSKPKQKIKKKKTNPGTRYPLVTQN